MFTKLPTNQRFRFSRSVCNLANTFHFSGKFYIQFVKCTRGCRILQCNDFRDGRKISNGISMTIKGATKFYYVIYCVSIADELRQNSRKSSSTLFQ